MTRSVALAPFLFLLACGGEPSPVVVGTVSSSVSTPVVVEVNGASRELPLGKERRFTLVGVPTGDLVLAFETEDASGALTIHEVQPGERIEVRIEVMPNRLEIVLVDRVQTVREVRDDDTDSDSDTDGDRDDEDWGEVVDYQADY